MQTNSFILYGPLVRVPALKQDRIPFSITTICSKGMYVFSARLCSQCEFLTEGNITSMVNVTENIFCLPQQM